MSLAAGRSMMAAIGDAAVEKGFFWSKSARLIQDQAPVPPSACFTVRAAARTSCGHWHVRLCHRRTCSDGYSITSWLM
jgi:hypothetical protein